MISVSLFIIFSVCPLSSWKYWSKGGKKKKMTAKEGGKKEKNNQGMHAWWATSLRFSSLRRYMPARSLLPSQLLQAFPSSTTSSFCSAWKQVFISHQQKRMKSHACVFIEEFDTLELCYLLGLMGLSIFNVFRTLFFPQLSYSAFLGNKK